MTSFCEALLQQAQIKTSLLLFLPYLPDVWHANAMAGTPTNTLGSKLMGKMKPCTPICKDRRASRCLTAAHH